MLVDTVFAQARATPGRTAVVHNGQACSYAGFARRIAQAHARLAPHGLRPGGVAVVCVDHLVQGWVLGIALRHRGLVTVQVGSLADIGALGLDDIACVVGIGDETLVPAQAPSAAWRWPLLRVDLDPYPGRDSARDPTPGHDAPDPPVSPNPPDSPCSFPDLPDAPAATAPAAGHLLLTSGTTGTQKKILRDAQAEAGTLALHAQINAIGADAVVSVRDFAPWTAGGYRWPLVTWSQGATVVFQQWQALDQAYLQPGLSHAFATPATLGFLLRPASAPGPAPRRDGMRLFVTGGAMTRAMAAAALSRLTVQLYTVLASTEALTLGVTLIDKLDDMAWHRIHPQRVVQVVDQSGEVLPHGQTGLVRAQLLDGLSGYVDDPASSGRFFRDGWFYSGDLGLTRPDGRLALAGRVTDVINVRGHKLASGPIERALLERLPATAACVLSMPGPEGAEEVHVALESAHTLSRDTLAALVQGPLQTLGRVQFHVLAAFPRNAAGKVQRLVLRQQLLTARRR